MNRLKTKYTRQKFLLNSTQYEGQTLEVNNQSAESSDFQEFGTPWNLLDVLTPCFTRTVSIRRMDQMIDTEEDWNVFLVTANQLDLLIINASSCLTATNTNPILRDYDIATLKAYTVRLANAGVKYAIIA